MKELLSRVLVAVAGIPALIFLIWQGGWYFFVLSAAIGLAGQWEMYRMSAEKGARAFQAPGYLITLLAMLYVMHPHPWIPTTILLLFQFILLAEMFRNTASAILNLGATLNGILYPGLLAAALLWLRTEGGNNGVSHPAAYILTVFVAIWANDTFAYFTGKSLGRRKLFERVSPKKSIEGLLGGIAGTFLVFFTVYFFQWYSLGGSEALFNSLIVGLAGPLGDLVESWFKRDSGLKDSSQILAAHGGILDRFDSLLFVAPFLVIFYSLY